MGIMVFVRKKNSELQVPRRDLSFTCKATELGSYMAYKLTSR